VEGGVDAVDADAWGRSDEFRPPDDVLGLAGVHAALPPIRLLHVGWRWYDPSLGRFVQRDPIGLADGLNVYVYCTARPLPAVDPCGTDRWIEWQCGLHPVVVVGPIGGEYYWLEFGPAVYDVWDWLWLPLWLTVGGPGRVYIHVERVPPQRPPDIRSTPAQDADALHELTDWWYYQLLWSNCIQFSHDIQQAGLPLKRFDRAPPGCTRPRF